MDTKTHTTEAPFSITYKLMYREVELLITDREMPVALGDGQPYTSNVTRQLGKAMSDIDWAMGTQKFTAPPQKSFGGGFAKKEPEYVPGKQCPICGKRMVKALKKDGSVYFKCEDNKWDKVNNRVMGCPGVDWNNVSQTHQITQQYQAQPAQGPVQQRPSMVPMDYSDFDVPVREVEQ